MTPQADTLTKLAQALAEIAYDGDRCGVAIGGGDPCPQRAVAVRWEHGFPDPVCFHHAETADSRGALVVYMKRYAPFGVNAMGNPIRTKACAEQQTTAPRFRPGSTEGTWRERSTHDVTRRGESTPCFCWADRNHPIGHEQRTRPDESAD